LPARLLVTVSRYQGDKKVSSMPYTMSLNAASRGIAQIRIGADVPITTGISQPVEGKPAPSLSYEQLGTNIDCRVAPTDDGRFVIELTVSEKSLYPDGEGPNVSRPAGNPPFRSFRANNTLVLRDGQSAEFAAAGDRVTGEIIRVEATLQLVK
jgi:type II secretory pathway component GspD/PulD (secretin)